VKATERLRRLECAALRQCGGDDGLPRFWVSLGDGFVRRGDEVLTEDQYEALYGSARTFTLRLGDSEPAE
jgi:hypothetical protein